MLLSDLASFPKGIIKMPRKFFVCIFWGIQSAFRSSCMFSRKTYRYLSFAWPKHRQVALLCGGSLKSWPVSTLHFLQPGTPWLCPRVGAAPGHRLGPQLQAKKALLLLSTGLTQKSSCGQNTHGQQAVLQTFFTEIKSPCFSTSDHH